MNQNIKISIIVPVYKVPERLLGNNIEHLIKQTLKEIEIILVDDGSPDNCGVICDNYAKQDNRIKVIHQKNKGLCGARNSGEKLAIGEYITFVDGDDFLEFNALELMYNVTKNKKYDIINACILKDFGNKTFKYDYSKIEELKEYKNDECLFWQEKVLDFNAHVSAVYAKLYKRSFLLKNNLFHDEVLRQGAEGLEFLIRVFGCAKSIIHINEYVYHYMWNNESISESHNESNHEMVINCFNRIKEIVETQENNDILLKCLYTRMLYVIVTTAISGYFNPYNIEPFKIKVKKYKKYLENELVKESLDKGDYDNLGMQRKIILYFIKHNMFHFVSIIAKLRKIQKQFKS